MDTITDEELIEIHQKAMELNLSKDFILLLKQELKKRGLAGKFSF